MSYKQEKEVFVVEKHVGETPLECIERLRIEADIARDIPMTYAGRLDPMASGLLLVLVGEACKNKEQYTALDKVYEVDIVFGIDTDTHDVLGRIIHVQLPDETILNTITQTDFLQKYVGRLEQEYPAFSSKTIDGVALHTHARLDTLPDTMPTKSVTIFSIKQISDSGLVKVTGEELAKNAIDKITLVHGDFRQADIIALWSRFAQDHAKDFFYKISISVSCSSGTYMRSLAKRIGSDLEVGAIATRIHRVTVGDFTL